MSFVCRLNNRPVPRARTVQFIAIRDRRDVQEENGHTGVPPIRVSIFGRHAVCGSGTRCICRGSCSADGLLEEGEQAI